MNERLKQILGAQRLAKLKQQAKLRDVELRPIWEGALETHPNNVAAGEALALIRLKQACGSAATKEDLARYSEARLGNPESPVDRSDKTDRSDKAESTSATEPVAHTAQPTEAAE